MSRDGRHLECCLCEVSAYVGACVWHMCDYVSVIGYVLCVMSFMLRISIHIVYMYVYVYVFMYVFVLSVVVVKVLLD